MSLINEALKKAQRQRTLENAPLSHAPTGVAAAAVTTHVAVASRHHRSPLAPICFGLGLLVLGVVSTVLIMRYGFDHGQPATVASTSTPVTVLPTTPTAAAPHSPAPVAPASVSVPAGTNTPSDAIVTFKMPAPAPAVPSPTPASTPAAPAYTAPAYTAPAPTHTPATVTPPPVVVIAPPPATTPTPVAPIATPKLSASEREARIYAFLSSIRLTGVRGLDRDARVLMNEKVFRLNDTVDTDLGLRLSGVRPGLLLFTDAQGHTYEKRH